jgi:hypothetical protein
MENKCWEYYAVRYFVGTVVGAAIVALLNADPASPFANRLNVVVGLPNPGFLGVGLLAALGFGFCYVASSPMLTLHSTRANLRLSMIRSRWGLVLAVIVSTAVAILWNLLPPLAATGSGVVIGFQLALVVVAVMNEFCTIESFYRDLATARANAVGEPSKGRSPGCEYVTSYRHLREHGNAVSIVVLEFVLAYVILRSNSQATAIVVIGLWILPSTTAWFLGTVLERRFASRPL